MSHHDEKERPAAVPRAADAEKAAESDAAPAAETGADTDDTEGHSLFAASFQSHVATTRAKEASEWARGEAARKQVREKKKQSR